MSRASKLAALFVVLVLSHHGAAAQTWHVFADATDTTFVMSPDSSIVQAFPPGVFADAVSPGLFILATLIGIPCAELPVGDAFCDELVALASIFSYSEDPTGGCCGQNGRVVFLLPVPLIVHYDESLLAGSGWSEGDIRLWRWNSSRLNWEATGAVVDAAGDTVTLEQVEPAFWYLLSAGPAPHRPPGGRWPASWGEVKQLPVSGASIDAPRAPTR